MSNKSAFDENGNFDIRPIDSRFAAISEGNWRRDCSGDIVSDAYEEGAIIGVMYSEADARLVAWAKTDIAHLIKRVFQLEDQIKTLKMYD